MYKNLNINPLHRRADDCAVRAIATALDKSWQEVYADLCIEGLKQYDMPSANHVWGSYLKKNGYKRRIVPDSCPECYTVGEFANDHPEGVYILALHGHVVPCVNGCVFDSWNCLEEAVFYYWEKEK